jgi:hypothetical protein
MKSSYFMTRGAKENFRRVVIEEVGWESKLSRRGLPLKNQTVSPILGRSRYCYLPSLMYSSTAFGKKKKAQQGIILEVI